MRSTCGYLTKSLYYTILLCERQTPNGLLSGGGAGADFV